MIRVFVASTVVAWFVLFAVLVGKFELLGDYARWTFTGGGKGVVGLAVGALIFGTLITTATLITRSVRTWRPKR